MISQTGSILQLIIILLEVGLIFGIHYLKYAKEIFYTKSLLVLVTFCLLIYGFIISDFSIQNVFLNSSSIKPLIFKISASWASHEGSMLLWLALISIIGSIFVFRISKITTKSASKMQMPAEPITTAIIILSSIELLFSSFIYFTSNPFFALSFTPTEGLGLNPVLQDIALNFHPPILYLGFVSYIIPFTCAIIILLQSNKNEQQDADTTILLQAAKTFSSFALFALTLGVGLGAWWAYRELGWGGFWFFDPVENISLVPWLFGIGLHHVLLITVKTKRLLKFTLTLSIITFLSCIFGTVLVRAGILTSIHSFASNSTRAIYLLMLFGLIAIFSIILLLKKKNHNARLSQFVSKDIAITLGSIFFMLAAVLLIISLIYPLIYQIIYDQNISLDNEFFVHRFLPIFIPILFLAGTVTTKQAYKKHLYFLFVAIIFTYITSYKLEHNSLSIFTTLGSISLILQTLNILLKKSSNFTKALSITSTSMILSHLGFGILVLAITLNSLLKEDIEFIGKIGDKVQFKQFEISAKYFKFAKGPNYYRQIAELWVEYEGETTILNPENRFYPIENSISMESDIYSYLFYDIYAILSKVENDTIFAQIYYNPFISFIWLAVGMISLGFFISCVGRKS